MRKHNDITLDIFIIILILGFFTFFKEEEKISYYEKRYLNKLPKFTIKKFINSEYQKELELSIADQIIYSEDIKKNYNKWYNITDFIKLKEKICTKKYINIGNYRSIYGCGGYIVYNPVNSNEISKKKQHNIFNSYNKLNKITDVYYYIVDTSIIFNFNDNKYSNNIYKLFDKNLKGKYKIKNFNFKNFNEYSKLFYKTDHHWNYKGSYKGYKEIMKMLDNDNILKPKRKVKLYGEKKEYGNEKVLIEKYSDKKENIPIKIDDLYLEFYGSNYGEVVFDFNDDSKENLLIISNSLDNAIDNLIASHFNKTYALDFRIFNPDKKFNIKKYIENNNISKVLVIADYFFLYDDMEIKTEWLEDGI